MTTEPTTRREDTRRKPVPAALTEFARHGIVAACFEFLRGAARFTRRAVSPDVGAIRRHTRTAAGGRAGLTATDARSLARGEA